MRVPNDLVWVEWGSTEYALWHVPGGWSNERRGEKKKKKERIERERFRRLWPSMIDIFVFLGQHTLQRSHAVCLSTRTSALYGSIWKLLLI